MSVQYPPLPGLTFGIVSSPWFPTRMRHRTRLSCCHRRYTACRTWCTGSYRHSTVGYSRLACFCVESDALLTFFYHLWTLGTGRLLPIFCEGCSAPRFLFESGN
ncbi:hypothetical protein C8R43DRAFT_1241713 [Mycena crocata]|nr:hypothetical protein C8R43DRAFT_1241713 [Mycena crocata]